MTGAASPGLQSVQPSSANIRSMSMLTTAARTNDKRGGGIVRANATQADPDGWQEWKNTFRRALFGVMDQGEIATTVKESTTPINIHDDISDNSDDSDDVFSNARDTSTTMTMTTVHGADDGIDMICFDCGDDGNDMMMACQCFDDAGCEG